MLFNRMPLTSAFRRLAPAVSLLVLFFAFATSAYGSSQGIVISQIYGAGGNSGAMFNRDFIELFNAGSTAVNIKDWALQYRSANGTSLIPSATEIAPLPDVTIQPGHYFLVAASAATSIGNAIDVDYDPVTATPSIALNLAAASGQVYLTNSTIAIAAGCPVSNDNIVDFVTYGTTTTTCYEGTGATGKTLSAILAAVRTSSCIDTNDNKSDFTASTPTPHNSSTDAITCTTGTVAFAMTASASPTAVNVGGTTTLTARVTPATNPSSTGISVTADLSNLGGSSTQPLYDDGTHGDDTANDNVYNYTAMIGGTASGSVTVQVTAKDAQAHSVNAGITLSITPKVAVTPIHTIQAGAPTSSYIGQVVTVDGIVTAVKSGGFYLQAPDNQADSDPSTSEAIYVISGSSSSIVVGNELQVTGTVQLSSTLTPAPDVVPATQLGGTITFTVESTGNTLPAATVMTAADDSPTGSFFQFLKYQSMRISIPNFITTAPTGGTLTETTETVTSNGQFWGVVQGVTRPFMETGISVLEYKLPSGPTYCTTTVTVDCVPRFDGNPENIFVDSTALGGAALDVTSNQTITNVLGIMDFNSNTATLLLDATAPGTLGDPMTFIPVPVASSSEWTIGTMNLERFYSDQAPKNGGLTLTTAAYQRRLAKASLLIRDVLRTPDILGVQEMGTLSTLQALASKISSDAMAAGETDPQYQPYLVQGNDSSGINVGFLINPSRVSVTDVTQFGADTKYSNATSTQVTLNDRPPLVLHAKILAAGNYPVTVINNHLKSLINIDDTTNTGTSVRLKREAQAEYLAGLIKGYQANGEHVVILGDMNAYQFSDGYVDTMGVAKGTPTPASQVVVGPSASYTAPSPAMVDLVTTIGDPLAQYDYSYNGNAQILDHIIVTPDMLSGTHLSYAHEDADFPLIQYNNANTPQSSSDHDGGVAYFTLTASVTKTATLSPSTQSFGSMLINSTSAAESFTLTNTSTATLNITSATVDGSFAISNNTCGSTLEAAASCVISVTFTPTSLGALTGTLTLETDASTPTLTASLNGVGTNLATLTPASATFSSTVVGTSSSAQTFTLTNVSGSAMSSSVAVTGDFTQTNTCGTSIASGASCSVSVVFTPTATGSRTGTLSVVATQSSQSITLMSSLTGTGGAVPDFALTPASPTSSVTAGGTASTSLTLTSMNNYTGTITLTCSGAPDTTSCSFSPTSATLAATGTATVVVSLTTKAASAAKVAGVLVGLGPLGMLLAALVLLVAASVMRGHKSIRAAGVLAVLMSLSLVAIGCGSGSSSSSDSGTSTPGTTKGSYPLTIRATDGTLTHTATYTVTVQ